MFVIDDRCAKPQTVGVLTKIELLKRAELKAKTRAKIGEVLNLPAPRITEMFKGTRDLSYDEARKLIDCFGLEEAAPGDSIAPDGLAMIPQLELGFSMGGGSVFEDYPSQGVMPFQRDWLRGLMRGRLDQLFVARGDGDSMEPTLKDGDIVLIDTAQRDILQQDRIWAVSYGDLGMIKRVRRLPGGTYQLISDNPNVTPISAYDGEMHVIGRVVWIGRRI